MKYFTAEEARNIIRKTPLTLACGFEDNPNIEAMITLLDIIHEINASAMYAASLGFILGMATGKREERTRRATV